MGYMGYMGHVGEGGVGTKLSRNSYSQFGLRGRAPRGLTGELSPASVYVSLLPVVEACVVVSVPNYLAPNLA